MQLVTSRKRGVPEACQEGATVEETIRFFKESVPWDYVRFEAISRWPILETNLSYRDPFRNRSLVPAMDVFLLVCTGYTRNQIAVWLGVSRDVINNLTRKLTKAGVPVRRASKPDHYTSIYPEGPSAQELKEALRVKEITSSIESLIERHERARSQKLSKWLRTDIYTELSRLHQHRDLKYELRTPAQKYRPMTEKSLEGLITAMKEHRHGRKVAGGVSSVREKAASSGYSSARGAGYADSLLLSYWTGNWSYDRAYQFGMFTKPEHEQRFETSLRTRCLVRCRKHDRLPCEICTSWLERHAGT